MQYIICIQYNKNWETLLTYLLRIKVSCKAAEIAVTRLLKAQSFFVCHATYKAFFKKKIPPIEITASWQIHWHASSLTLLINIQAAGQSNWPLLSFLLLYWIAGIGIVIHYKHNLIHSYIQSLNPILKILKFKYLQIRHKPCNQLATKAQSFPRKSSNTASPMIAHLARDSTWNRGRSSNSPPLTHGDQIPHPLKTLIIKFPPPRDGKGAKCLGYAWWGGGLLKLRFGRYIVSMVLWLSYNILLNNNSEIGRLLYNLPLPAPNTDLSVISV